LKIEALFRQDVVCADPDETLTDVARRMEWVDVSCLPVMSDGELIGIITERDVTRAAAAGVDPTSALVARFMTIHPFTADPDEDSSVVARRMLDLGVRHLPVVRGGAVVGVISARDLLALEAWQTVSG
jgi:CBS domain-containing protein